MSLSRDEDHYYLIIRISTIVSSLSFVTIVWFLCFALLCIPLRCLHRFVVIGPMRCTRLSVPRCIVHVCSHCTWCFGQSESQFLARRKHLAVSKRWSRHDDIRRLNLEVITISHLRLALRPDGARNEVLAAAHLLD